MNAEHHRLFIAVPVPEPVRGVFAAVQGELGHHLPEGSVTWTKPEQLHITLKFLGAVNVRRLEELTQRLRSACEELLPLRLSATGAGAFPDLRFPRVIWTGIKEKEGHLTQAHRAVEEVCQEFTSQEPEKVFSAHVTLGRAKRLSKREAQILSRALAGMPERFFGEWTATNLELMRSELSSSGARHSSIAQLQLMSSRHSI